MLQKWPLWSGWWHYVCKKHLDGYYVCIYLILYPTQRIKKYFPAWLTTIKKAQSLKCSRPLYCFPHNAVEQKCFQRRKACSNNVPYVQSCVTLNRIIGPTSIIYADNSFPWFQAMTFHIICHWIIWYLLVMQHKQDVSRINIQGLNLLPFAHIHVLHH